MLKSAMVDNSRKSQRGLQWVLGLYYNKKGMLNKK
jgi:hypothetical protein